MKWQDEGYLELADLEADEYRPGSVGLWTRGLLIRRSIADGAEAFFTTWRPALSNPARQHGPFLNRQLRNRAAAFGKVRQASYALLIVTVPLRWPSSGYAAGIFASYAQSRSVCRSMPQFLAASARPWPSNTKDNAKSRRATHASVTRAVAWLA